MKTLSFQDGSAFMELDLFEMAFILITVVGVLGLAFTLAWMDASSSKAKDQGPD